MKMSSPPLPPAKHTLPRVRFPTSARDTVLPDGLGDGGDVAGTTTARPLMQKKVQRTGRRRRRKKKCLLFVPLLSAAF